ncbi:MAG: hypothetical protein L6R38_000973 [Xanthoria sp. 2 TBL-2021]|nr:MAG: hypothetical protein L6R38_000973 [Xanthoria sp. 2 TBL-2021]
MAKARKFPKLPVQQLVILALCRLADPISFSSVFPYLPEMIESFNVPKDEVGRWAGITSAVFSLSQAATGIFWGRASDRYGRKPVILTAMICVMSTGLLFGFSRNLGMAIVARSLAGASNGNVGILRTTVAEIVPWKELQPRAFSVMPLMWTIGSIFGPGFGGALANPAARYPQVFGNDFFRKFPYALPNIVASLFFLVGLTAGTLFLKESLESKRHRRDCGRAVGKSIVRIFKKKPRKSHPPSDDEQSTYFLGHSRGSFASSNGDDLEARQKPILQEAPTYREVFSRQSNINLLTYTLLALHSVAYDQLLPVFMHHPPQHGRSSNSNVSLPFKFSGGFGIDSDRIGVIFTLYGVAGTMIQFLVFPPLARYYGVLNSLKVVTIIFPLVYVATPFTALLPSPLAQQIVMFVIMLVKCFATIFAFPCTTILLTNSAVSLRILGTLNGVATSVSAIGRATGPALSGVMFETGSKKGWAILPWWVLAGFAVLGAIPVWWLVEMEGFGASENTDDGEEGYEEPEVPRAEEGETSKPIMMGSPESIPRNEADDFTTENTELLSNNGLSKASSTSSGAAVGTPLKRISSPIGLKKSPGPEGNDLCNGLGHSRNGFGAGGTSYH